MFASACAWVVLGLVSAGEVKMKPVGLRCEGMVEPLGVDSAAPRLSWVFEAKAGARDLRQEAYQVLVARSLSSLAAGKGELWDSGRVAGSAQNNIEYKGRGLKTGEQCFWKVRTWGADGSSSWSKPAKWEMGILSFSDWKAKWIDDGKPVPAKDEDFYKEDPVPLFRKEFGVRGPVARARLAVSGLGYYEASLNGSRVGDHVLDPGWTRIEKRVLYSVFDVTSQLRKGKNCIGVMVGNGWYNPLPLKLFGSFNLREHLVVGRPRVIAQLTIEYKDGSSEVIGTDESWSVGEGPIVRNNVYLGEVYDARREQSGWDCAGFDAGSWRACRLAVEGVGPLVAPSQPPIRVTSSWTAKAVSSPKPGVFIYDMGVNFSGWVQLKVSLGQGQKIRLRYGELLHKDGTLNPMTSVAGQIKWKRPNGESAGGPGAPEIAWQEDTVIGNGGEVSYEPTFTFHGFRYIEVTGLTSAVPLTSVVAKRLNSDVESVGEFECSNPMLNEVQAMCRRTFLSNIFSVQSDCPHRERLGYGGDIVATSEAFMANFDMSGFYAKAVRDWSDSARPDGMFTDTAPFMGIQYCGVIWAMAPVLLAEQLHQYYGDYRIGAEEYEAARRWLAVVERKYSDGIVTDGLSDHEGLEPTPSPEMVTPMYYWCVKLMARAAGRLGRTEDRGHFETLASMVQKAYLTKFFDASTGKVGIGSQSNQAIGLKTGIVPTAGREKALGYLVNAVHDKKDHLSTGILGTNYMLQALSQSGQTDLAQ